MEKLKKNSILKGLKNIYRNIARDMRIKVKQETNLAYINVPI